MKNRETCLVLATSIAALFGLVATAGVAMAHAFPSSESPCAGAVLKTPPTEVKILYDAPIEQAFSKLKVLDASGHERDVGGPHVGKDHRTLSVKVDHLSPGQYEVKWSVVADDGHRTFGSYTFTVSGKP